ncbi:putative Der1-like family protein [Blattamonas nauphoetae]|uniref:Derlin n=1 Tax=Blattamonas nauphoetae TaxID=2049346 RepID=A0ABQ9Y0A3_9EUKA|nr:putative Der1-like family protein [Blattamonas nauphoetae]
MDTNPLRQLGGLPTFTGLYLLAITGVTAAVHFNKISLADISFSFPLIWDNFEIYRLFTSFCFLGDFDLNWLFLIFSYYGYLAPLENKHFEGRKKALFAFFGVIWLLINVICGLLWPYQRVNFPGSWLRLIVIYVSSRHPSNRGNRVSIMGLFTIPMSYLPLGLFAVSLIMGQLSILEALICFFFGHTLYYLFSVLPNPKVGGPELLRFMSPDLKAIPNRRSEPSRPHNPQPSQWGSGNRLGG